MPKLVKMFDGSNQDDVPEMSYQCSDGEVLSESSSSLDSASITPAEYNCGADSSDASVDGGEQDEEDVPDRFLCPLTMEMFRLPMMTREGRTFEGSAILKWLETDSSCPLTRQPLFPSDLINNHAMKVEIHAWCVRHNKPTYVVGIFETMYSDCRSDKEHEILDGYFAKSVGQRQSMELVPNSTFFTTTSTVVTATAAPKASWRKLIPSIRHTSASRRRR